MMISTSEVNARFEGLPAYWAGLDPKSASEAPALWAAAKQQMNSARDMLKREFNARLGPEKMKTFCESYPVFLESERFNLQHYRANAIATIRSGPEY